MKRSLGMIGLVSMFCFVLVLSGILPGSYKTALAADAVIKWKCQAHVPAVSDHYRDGLLVTADLVRQRTGGRLIIEPYPVGAFVPAVEVFSAVKRGMLQAGFSSSAYIQDQVPLAAVSNGLPFGLANTVEAEYYIQNLGIEKMMQEAMVKQGMYYFSALVNSWELVSKKPMRTVEDFKGLKVRSAGLMAKLFAAIGAAPTFLPGAEVYPALATGVVDAAHFGSVAGADSFKLYEVCKYHLTTPLLFGASTIWLINKNAFDKLPEDIQRILTTTLVERFWEHSTMYHVNDLRILSRLEKEEGVEATTLPPAEYKKIQEAAKKLWDQVAAKGPECAKGVQILKDFNKSMGR